MDFKFIKSNNLNFYFRLKWSSIIDYLFQIVKK